MISIAFMEHNGSGHAVQATEGQSHMPNAVAPVAQRQCSHSRSHSRSRSRSRSISALPGCAPPLANTPPATASSPSSAGRAG